MSDKDQTPRSPATRVSVNGDKIKYIRESKVLTQLYVANYLGVTTDTVSRWENGRYPTVKWENVEKLAEALEIDPDELLDSGTADSGAKPPRGETANRKTMQPSKPGLPLKLFIALVLSAIFALLAGIVYLNRSANRITEISATRFLPEHIAPGQPFPVVVRVVSGGDEPFTFIMEEKLPEKFTVIRGLPEVASIDPQSNTVKWISNSRHSPFFLAYLVQTPADLQSAATISFIGRIKADNAPRFEQKVLGDSLLAISNYHWVDTDSDGVIDDEEILTAFSSADVLQDLGVDMDLIRKIWSAGGYGWDEKSGQYRIGKQKEGTDED